jgi:hypothetical protein
MRAADVEVDVPARTDHSIDDEPAGVARREHAAASKAKKAAQAKRLTQQNAELRRRSKQANSRTDVSIADEEAGRARTTMAEASKSRKERREARIALENEELRTRRDGTHAQTDNDIGDEEAGRARVLMAEASKAQRLEDVKRIAQENAEMRQRLAEVSSRSVDQYHGGNLLDSLQLEALERASSLHVATFAKMEACKEKLENGAEMRTKRTKLVELSKRHADEWAAMGAEKVRERRERERHNKKLQEELTERKQRIRRALLADSIQWQTERVAQQRATAEEHRLRVLDSAQVTSKLGAREAAAQKKEREAARRERAETAKQGAQLGEHFLHKRRVLVEGIVAERAACALTKASQEREARSCVRAKHAESRELEVAKARQEEEYLERARRNRERAAAIRDAAKRSMGELLEERRQAATRERDNDHLVAEAKARIVEANRREVAIIYKKRFATRREESEWEGSPLRRLQRAATSAVNWRRKSSSMPDPRLIPGARPSTTPTSVTV